MMLLLAAPALQHGIIYPKNRSTKNIVEISSFKKENILAWYIG
jgi:hypothetical protein